MDKIRENMKESVAALSRIILSMSEFTEMTYKMAGEAGAIRNLRDLEDYVTITGELASTLNLLATTLAEVEMMEEGEE